MTNLTTDIWYMLYIMLSVWSTYWKISLYSKLKRNPRHLLLYNVLYFNRQYTNSTTL